MFAENSGLFEVPACLRRLRAERPAHHIFIISLLIFLYVYCAAPIVLRPSTPVQGENRWEMGQTKITVKVHKGLLAKFNQDIDRIFLKRDAYLNQLIRIETPRLAEDLAGKRLSSKAKHYIAGRLKRMDIHPVNVVVDQDVADALNVVVQEANIVRDAFTNRLLWFLQASDVILNYLNLPRFINYSEFERSIPEAMPTAPMAVMRAIQSDPLHYLHVGCEDRHATGLYLLDVPDEFTGFLTWARHRVDAGAHVERGHGEPERFTLDRPSHLRSQAAQGAVPRTWATQS